MRVLSHIVPEAFLEDTNTPDRCTDNTFHNHLMVLEYNFELWNRKLLQQP